MKNLINKKQKNYKIYTALSIILNILALSLPILAGGSGVSEVDTAGRTILNIVFFIVRVFGAVVAMWGAVEMGLGIKAQDPVQRANGVKGLLGGIIILFSKEIISVVWPGINSI